MLVDLSAEITRFCETTDFTRTLVREGYYAVVLAGPREAYPARFGDNRGVIAATLGRTHDVKAFLKRLNENQPHQNYEALHVAWTESAQHATRLLDAMTILCLGPDKEHHHFRRYFDWTEHEGRWWELVALAQAKIKARGETVDAFDDAEMRRRAFAASRRVWRRG